MAALKYADSAYNEACRLSDTTYIFESATNRASIYAMNGNYDIALEHYLNAFDLINLRDTLQVADYLTHIASVYYYLEDSNKSHQYNDQAFLMYQQKNDTLGMAWSHNLKGLNYVLTKEYDLAKIAFQYSLMFNKALDNTGGVYLVYNNMSTIPEYYKSSIANLYEAIDYAKTKNEYWVLAENYNNLANLYLHEQDYKEARKYNLLSKHLADSLSNPVLIRDNLKTAISIAEAEGDYKKAFLDLKKVGEMDRELASAVRIRAIEYEAGQRREIISQLNHEKQNNRILQSEQKKRLLLISIVFSLTLIILSVLYLLLLKVKKLNTHVENEIRSKDEIRKELAVKESQLCKEIEQLNTSKAELTNIVFFLKSKDKLLDNILSLLQEAQRKSETDPKVKIKSIIALIKSFKDKEIKTNIFSSEINKAEEQFIERLKEKHPDLSKNEIVLSTLLRINLTSKEIALLLDSSPKTVNMARYRLRRKLELDTDDNLVHYFEQM
ncbi:MAG: tetratricopeptide repeat protein [Bacteroidales bacterium]